jgi:hypothetical protein
MPSWRSAGIPKEQRTAQHGRERGVIGANDYALTVLCVETVNHYLSAAKDTLVLAMTEPAAAESHTPCQNEFEVHWFQDGVLNEIEQGPPGTQSMHHLPTMPMITTILRRYLHTLLKLFLPRVPLICGDTMT